MPTNIKQIDDPERNKTVLQVKGELSLSDAELLEKIALDLSQENGKPLAIDLADLGFLDSEAAPVLKRIQEVHGFEIEGLQFFLQKIIDEAEKR